MNNWLALLAALVGFGIIFFERQHHQSFLVRVFTGMILGGVIGIIFKGATDYVATIGTIYVNMLLAMVVPVLFFSITYTVSSLGSIKSLTDIGGKAIGFLSLHNVLGSLLAIIAVTLFGIGKNASVIVPQNAELAEVPSVTETIISFFPENIVNEAANNRVIPIIVFSTIMAIAILLYEDKEKIKPFTDFLEAGNHLIFSVVGLVTRFTPYAVLALIANRISGIDGKAISSMLVVMISVMLAGLFHSVVTTSGMLFFIGRLNPMRYMKKYLPAWIIAFTTQSSVGSIPTSVAAQRRLGVPEEVASFSASIGSSFGVPGCGAIWPTILALFTANAMGVHYQLTDYLLIIVVNLLVSAGTVGVPGMGTINAVSLFTAIGLPVEVIILMTPIAAIADMVRTATNVSAGGSTGVLVAKMNRTLDVEQYNREDNSELVVED
ncbi:MAG: dicarboxylate/amino acid:cation symporter [Aerococcus sp.]|nr:dicarboxylate/amino acid:cation symporter [Aerococcus sp.]